MSPYPPGFLGISLLLFTVATVASIWYLVPRRVKPTLAFLILHLASLALALAFVFGSMRRSDSHLVEIGQYYPVSASPTATTSLPPPTLRIGDPSQSADYAVNCVRQPCFGGWVDFRFEQKAGAPNLLSWAAQVGVGNLRIFKVADGAAGRLIDRAREWVNLGRGHASEQGSAELPGQSNQVRVMWEPPEGSGAGTPVDLTVTFDLSPPDAGARIVVEPVNPRRVQITQVPEGDGEGRTGRLPTLLYVTSSTQPVALRARTGDGYVPTVSVGAADPACDVNVFLSRPQSPEEESDDFIVNNGLTRNGYPFGARAYVGGSRGVVATVVSTGGPLQLWSYAGALLILWALPFWFFRPLAGNAKLFGLVATVQMLLAVRFVLALRAYVWTPHSTEAIETSIFALVFIPFLLGLGCHAVGLHEVGSVREQHRGWRGALLRDFRPTAYYAGAVLIFPLVWMIMQEPAMPYAAVSVLAFQDWGEMWRYWRVLIAVPPLVGLAGLLIDHWLRHRSRRDEQYVSSENDPFTHLFTRPGDPESMREGWSRRYLLYILGAGLLGAGVFSVTLLTGLLPAGWQPTVGPLAVGAACLGWAYVLGRVGAELGKGSRLYGLAARCFQWLAGIIGVLLLAKGLWNAICHNLLGLSRAVPESFFPLVPVRTTTVFELIILIMTVRLLSIFVERWRDINTSFGWREFREALAVFLVPLLMMGTTLLASNDTGAMLVHGPALIGATLLVTGLWPLWKAAAGRRWALVVIALMAFVLIAYYSFAALRATRLIPLAGEHSTITHRTLLLQGTEAAGRAADTGGRQFIGAIEQHWRMLNYAAEGEWVGKGYGQAPIPGGRTFRLITLDDLVFSVYVLAEHGALAGWALIALYLLLFSLAAWMMWDRLRDSPTRLALAGGATLMLVFPALYMAAANVNELIFTGQSLPLLGLRSLSDVLRSGLALMLLGACLRPTTITTDEAAPAAAGAPSWWRLSLQGFSLLRLGKQARQQRLRNLDYNPWTAAAAVATNIALVGVLLSAAALIPAVGIARASGNEDYKIDLDLKHLEERASKYIADGHVWYEPVTTGNAAGVNCRGGAARNASAPPEADPTTAYQLCMDSDIRGGGDGDTIAQAVSEWNTQRVRGGADLRAGGRGNLLNRRFDDGQFFQLDLTRVQRFAKAKPGEAPPPLLVNSGKYQWRSPFRPLRGWRGALVEGATAQGDGGVLLGAGVVLPLRAAQYGETPVFVGANPGYTEVTFGSPRVYRPSRGFSIFAPGGRQAIFKVETVSGAEGALLSPAGGDFDLYLNGCPLIISGGGERCAGKEGGGAVGTAPKVRLEYGDVVAYATRDQYGRRSTSAVFVYSRAQLGAFSYIAWVDGAPTRFYPQADAWPMAEQITNAINASAEADRATWHDVALTVDAELNRQVYDLLRRWRACLDGSAPRSSSCREQKAELKQRGSSRQMAVTLMDTDTGALLTLASDAGTPYNQNGLRQRAEDEGPNLNLTRHRVGSAIKPFTAAATLSTFPLLHQLTLVDGRSDRRQVFGLPLGGDKREINARADEVGWNTFLSQSDNLYAVTFALLGMSDGAQTNGLPRFSRGPNPTGPFRLELNNRDSSLGVPAWGNMFNPQRGRIELLDQSPLARRLDELFDVRASLPPQVASYDTTLWSSLKPLGLMREQGAYNVVSPEITNFAFDDIENFSDLRSVLLGGEFRDLPQYGRVGAAWSNVKLAESFARIVSGRRVTTRIVADPAAAPPAEWFPGAPTAAWRRELLRGLEGVTAAPHGTAYAALNGIVRQIAASRSQGETGRFAVFSKTGTLELYEDSPLLDDSIYVFSAGIWDEEAGNFLPGTSVTAAIYFEQGSRGRSQAFAAELLALLNQHQRFNWSDRR